MTIQARIEALTSLGFTARQAAFLVTVLLQGGVCVARQYCESPASLSASGCTNSFNAWSHAATRALTPAAIMARVSIT